MRPLIRRLALAAAIFLAGVGVGRFAVPFLEPRNETTAIFAAKNGQCGYALSITEYLLGRPRYLVDGGDGLKCGERKPLSRDAFVACECY